MLSVACERARARARRACNPPGFDHGCSPVSFRPTLEPTRDKLYPFKPSQASTCTRVRTTIPTIPTPPTTRRQIRNLVRPNKADSDAVDARCEMDLRCGAAFTRFQTKLLQNRYDEVGQDVISYGPCQFPTLGFVVDRKRWWRSRIFLITP